MVAPPYTNLLPKYRHGRPAPPEAASVGGRGSDDQSDTGRALRDPQIPLPEGLQGWGDPALGYELVPGDSILSGAACIGGGPHPWNGSGEPGRGRPVCNGAYLALIILHPG